MIKSVARIALVEEQRKVLRRELVPSARVDSLYVSSSHHLITKITRVIRHDSGCSNILDDGRA